MDEQETAGSSQEKHLAATGSQKVSYASQVPQRVLKILKICGGTLIGLALLHILYVTVFKSRIPDSIVIFLLCKDLLLLVAGFAGIMAGRGDKETLFWTVTGIVVSAVSLLLGLHVIYSYTNHIKFAAANGHVSSRIVLLVISLSLTNVKCLLVGVLGAFFCRASCCCVSCGLGGSVGADSSSGGSDAQTQATEQSASLLLASKC